MLAKFSEENYRYYLNQELVSENNIFIPTQPDEFSLGVDMIMSTQNHQIFNLWGQRIGGISVDEKLWRGTDRTFDNIELDLEFQANLFIQAKRPEFIRIRSGAEYEDWNRPYFRYKIDVEQQKILSKLESNLANNALVLYASPACTTRLELKEFANKKIIVQNSNFTKATDLDNHTRYTYTDGGTGGYAYSRPTEIKSLSFKEELKKLKSFKTSGKNIQFIRSLAESITKTVEELDEEFRFDYNIMLESFKEKNGETDLQLNKIYSFLFITDVRWYILHR